MALFLNIMSSLEMVCNAVSNTLLKNPSVLFFPYVSESVDRHSVKTPSLFLGTFFAASSHQSWMCKGSVGDVYQSAPSPRFGSTPLWRMGIEVIGAVQSPRVQSQRTQRSWRGHPLLYKLSAVRILSWMRIHTKTLHLFLVCAFQIWLFLNLP